MSAADEIPSNGRVSNWTIQSYWATSLPTIEAESVTLDGAPMLSVVSVAALT